MKYEIISAFIDRRTGEKIDPGQPVPEGLDKDTIARLVQAQCLRPVEGKGATSKRPQKSEENQESQPTGDGADKQPEGQPGGDNDAPGLFSNQNAGEGSGTAGASGEAAAAAASQPAGGRRGRRTADTGNAQ